MFLVSTARNSSPALREQARALSRKLAAGYVGRGAKTMAGLAAAAQYAGVHHIVLVRKAIPVYAVFRVTLHGFSFSGTASTFSELKKLLRE